MNKIFILVVFITLNYQLKAQKNDSFYYNDSGILVKYVEFYVPKPLGLISDYENILGANAIKNIEFRIIEIEKKTSVEIAVLTADSTILPEDSFNNYSLFIMNSWKLGKPNKNNGILIVISDQYKKVRIHVGKGLKKQFTEEEIKKIISENMLPYFQKGQYQEGLQIGLKYIQDILTNLPPKPQPKKQTPKKKPIKKK